jgi:endonuclease/exonuclease/phosphatase family metal-dependent hydrolase
MISWLKLRDKQSDSKLVVMNTHWDWQDPDARERSARLMRERIPSIVGDLPVIAMGDFNAFEGSAELKAIRGDEPTARPRLVDSYRTLYPTRKADEATYHGHAGTTEGERIDFILCSEQFEPIEAAIIRTNFDGRWPSDHYPVTATLRYKPQQ